MARIGLRHPAPRVLSRHDQAIAAAEMRYPVLAQQPRAPGRRPVLMPPAGALPSLMARRLAAMLRTGISGAPPQETQRKPDGGQLGNLGQSPTGIHGFAGPEL